MENNLNDYVENFQLNPESLGFVRSALAILSRGFTIPKEWWAEHIVDRDTPFDISLLDSTAVINYTKISVFDSIDTVREGTRAYTETLYDSLARSISVASDLLDTLVRERPVAVASLTSRGIMSIYDINFLVRTGFFIEFKHASTSAHFVTFSTDAYIWAIEKNKLGYSEGFIRWSRKAYTEITQAECNILISRYSDSKKKL